MRRAKLAPGSVPSGSLPTAICQVIPCCFVCDEPIKSHRLSTSLLAGRTQYTHSPLPTKIGGYIGDEFVVVVTPQDSLCKHCMALINTMDRLELQLRQHRYTLTQHLKAKYNLDGYDSKQISSNKVSEVEDEIINVSDEEWIPNKRQRTEAVKQHRCSICNVSFSNLNVFMAHLSHHKQQGKSLPSGTSVKPPTLNIVKIAEQVIMFKCGCCSASFVSKDSLAQHMHLHTGYQVKSKACSSVTLFGNKTESEVNSTMSDSISNKAVGAAALFEDVEHLPATEASQPAGACSEEQKGRVCLLALLNNGVCSDISHRIPIECPAENASKDLSKSNVSNELHSDDINDMCTNSPLHSFTNGVKLVEQQNPSALGPIQINSSSHLHDNSEKNNETMNTFSTKVMDGSLDLPDLSDSPCSDPPVQKSIQSSCKDPIGLDRTYKWSGINSKKVLGTPSVSSSSKVVHSMPSLTDEEVEQGAKTVQENCFQISDESGRKGDLAGSSELTPPVPSCNLGKHVSLQVNEKNDDLVIATAPASSISSPSDQVAESVGNISIVSVTSMGMNSNSVDNESIGDNWFFSLSGKDHPSSDDKTAVNDGDSCLQDSWLADSNQFPESDKKEFIH